MKLVTVYVPALLLLGVMIGMVLWPEPIALASGYVAGMGQYSLLVFVGVLIMGVVFAPVTVMPLIPIGTALFGPFLTGVLSVIGWTIGGSIAFLVSRHLGRPVLERWLNLSKVDDFVAKFPPHLHFWSIVLLRHILPVDVLSYALGLAHSIRFTTFFFATLVGVVYFSFAFAYMGEAIFTGNTILLLKISLVSVAIFALGWYLVRHQRDNL